MPTYGSDGIVGIAAAAPQGYVKIVSDKGGLLHEMEKIKPDPSVHFGSPSFLLHLKKAVLKCFEGCLKKCISSDD